MKHNNNAVVIWLTGLPCSGKTTLAIEIEKYFKANNMSIQRLDGDVVRETVCNDLGFSKEDRDKNIQRISYIAQMLSDNGVNVVSAFVSPYREMREFTKSICSEVIEIYVKCDIEICRQRDVKGMYKKADKGEINNFTGVQDPFEEPLNAEITVNTGEESIEESLNKIINYMSDKYEI